MAFNPRQERLQEEWIRLQELNRESDHVHVEPVNVLPGAPPEQYHVTLRCRGIIGIDGNQSPVYGDQHLVEIKCDDSFPADVPLVRWLSPIWHPNVQHEGARCACLNKTEWLGGMMIYDVCRQLFEMTQYKNYHAELTPPFPYDRKVAEWVRDVAEPRGVVHKARKIYTDDRPFVRPMPTGPKISIRRVESAPPQGPPPQIRMTRLP